MAKLEGLFFYSISDLLFRMWPSVKILFWALFGLIELDSFEAESDTETAVGTALLALWLVLAVIVLLNMLIALISNAFQRVQVIKIVLQGRLSLNRRF